MSATTPQARSLTALIADDHAFVRNWLRDELQRIFPEFTQIMEADNPRETIARALSQTPDVIFVDIDFENDRSVNGIDIAEHIWKERPETAIVIVSSHKEEIYVKHLYRVLPPTGAYAYVLKDKVAQRLTDVVNTVLAGDCWIDPDVARVIKRLERTDTQLTDNEYEALVLIALGLSDQTAARMLYLTDKAVQARLQSLYAKFSIPPKGDPHAGVFNPRCRAVRCALQRGLVNEAEIDAWAEQLQPRFAEVGLNAEL